MKVGFLLDRIVNYKVFGSVIDQALKEGADVTALHNNLPEGKTGPKAYQWANPGRVPEFRHGRPQIEVWKSWEELEYLCTHEGLDVLVSQWIKRDYRSFSQKVRATGTKWLSLQHSYEHFVMSFSNFAHADLTCLYSDYWIEHTLTYLSEQINGQQHTGESAASYFRRITASTGFPELDQLALVDRDAVRKRLHIPQGQPVVLFITFGLLWQGRDRWEDLVFAQPSRWASLRQVLRRGQWDLLPYAWQAVNYEMLLRSVRTFCDRNGAFLISKSRIKDAPPMLEMQLADYHTFDEYNYPHTILELLAIADLVIHPVSTVGLEAAFASAPSVALMPPHRVSQIDAFPHKMIFEKLRYTEVDSIFNFAGVSYPMDMIEAVQRLAEARLSDFPLIPERRAAYVEKYLGFDDYNSAARVWRQIETLHG